MRKSKRCAIYTRKSTEEGLEQNFNSLDAQREACAAFILSQAHEGWEQIQEHYDDGGWSGGTIERPALKQLLADIEAGKVDIIVVYKVDRLTRSLADFAKIVEILDEKGASFVSVTQAFNTTNSMGRLTLNVLLSFAQFEREVTGERIRDKIAASKKKGMWMGGPVPLGFRVEDRRLVVEPDEASTVQLIFERYEKLGSIADLVDDLAARGVRTKRRAYKNGRTAGGITFAKGSVAALLKNPIYTGRIRHKGKLYDGKHDSIVDAELFKAVQNLLKCNAVARRNGANAKDPSLLAGLLIDPDGRPMSPSHTVRRGRRYRYYLTRHRPGEGERPAWRIAAGEIEKAASELTSKWMLKAIPHGVEEVQAWTKQAKQLDQLLIKERRAFLLKHELNFALDRDAVKLIDPNGQTTKSISIPARLICRAGNRRLIIENPDHTVKTPKPSLLKLLAQADAARRMVVDGRDEPMVAGFSKRYLWQLLRIAWLSPDIVSDIVEGRQPSKLTGRQLLRAAQLPLDWSEQRAFLGFN